MKNPGGTLGWAVPVLLLALAPVASAVEASGSSIDGGGVFAKYPVDGVPLLKYFFFQFTDGDDHNIQAISVQPASPVPDPCFDCYPTPEGQIFVTLQDEDRDDPYGFQIQHVDVPVGVRRRIADYCTDTCRLPLVRPARDSVFVIVGFSFFYPGADHHIQRIGLWEEDGEVVVHFRDETGDDQFRFELEYVYLPPSMVPKRGNVSGVNASGSAVAHVDLGPVATGPTVLRGFDFLFRPELDVGLTYDQELHTFGIRTRDNKIEVIFWNDDFDLFDWGVDWGAVKVSVLDPPRR